LVKIASSDDVDFVELRDLSKTQLHLTMKRNFSLTSTPLSTADRA